jgi:hypothetical protein
MALICWPVFAMDEQPVTVTNSLVDKTQITVNATLHGKPTQFFCFTDGPDCAGPSPGEYSMVRTANDVDAPYQDCTNIALYKSSEASRQRVGVYCWSGSGDCYMFACTSVQANIFPLPLPRTTQTLPLPEPLPPDSYPRRSNAQSLELKTLCNGLLLGRHTACRTYASSDGTEVLIWYGTLKSEPEAAAAIQQLLKAHKVTDKELVRDPSGKVIGDRTEAAPMEVGKAFVVIRRCGLNFWFIQSASLAAALQADELVAEP